MQVLLFQLQDSVECASPAALACLTHILLAVQKPPAY